MNQTRAQTDAPAAAPKQYRPADHETRILERWESSGAFHADPDRVLRGEARPYCILIPPPNVTDRLHLGHALNNSLQDILVRAHRMMGFETLWMPGTDHAGIATQAVVERRLRAEGKLNGPLRESMSREDFIAAVQSFKDEYEATITDQLKRMGCSCDWQRQRFTMDEICARAVREAFFRLFRDGLIYRGKRLVNWDPVLQTAVADDEVEDIEVDGHFYYLRYPLMHPWRDDDEPTPVTWSELFARGYPQPAAALEPATAGEYEDDKPAWLTVATTRPETYLGDTAVAVNPRDPRAPSLRDLCVELPLVGRAIPIIEDEYVVMPAVRGSDVDDGASDEGVDPKAQYATGFLKVTPAHDPNDYEIWQRHQREMFHGAINILAPDATISDKHGWEDVRDAHLFVGKSREEARKLVLREFQARGLLENIRDYRHSVKHSDRSKAVIEPYLSDQWYVRVTDDRMRGWALDALNPEQRSTGFGVAGVPPASSPGSEESLTFHPSRYAKTFESWHENIRDWCISRQLWWGHRIPVWVSAKEAIDDALEYGRLRTLVDQERVCIRESENGQLTFVCLRSQEDAEAMKALGIEEGSRSDFGYSQDPDVLDTWFSSALWPLSTLGWPQPPDDMKGLLEAFNPTSTLCTAREIITLWVSRMVMFNRYFKREGDNTPGSIPFHDVFIHALIMDGDGRKMSKSLGNGVDPLDIIATHGADAMRFTLCHMTTQTQDVRMPVVRDEATGRNTSPKFDFGRNFCNKLWNAANFALSILESGRDAPTTVNESAASNDRTDLSLPDRWMLSRLAAGVDRAETALRNYDFSDYAEAIYDLLWRDFCDWYIEAIKPTVMGNPAQQAVLAHALETIIRILHPVCPFITEAIWERVRHVETAPVPGLDLSPSRVGGLLCTAGWPRVSASLRDKPAEQAFSRMQGLISAIREVRAQHQVPPKRRVKLHAPVEWARELVRYEGLVEFLSGLSGGSTSPPEGPSAAFTYDSAEFRLSEMADAVDAAAERARLTKARDDLAKSVATLESRLANPGYSQRAPAHLVEQTRQQLAALQAELATTTAALEALL